MFGNVFCLYPSRLYQLLHMMDSTVTTFRLAQSGKVGRDRLLCLELFTQTRKRINRLNSLVC